MSSLAENDTGMAADVRNTGVGDITGDGRADVVSRDTSGALYRNNGNGKGSFGGRTKLATGWQSYHATRPLSPAGRTPRRGNGADTREGLLHPELTGHRVLHVPYLEACRGAEATKGLDGKKPQATGLRLVGGQDRGLACLVKSGFRARPTFLKYRTHTPLPVGSFL